MKLAPSIKLLVSSMAVAAVTSFPVAALEKGRFFVECHSFVPAQGGLSKDYAYHLRAFGYPEAVANGINVNLDQENIVLSVDSKQSREEEYTPLYAKLPLIMRREQPCIGEQCKQVAYEPKNFPGTLVVTYDKDNGEIFIKHILTPKTTIQARGGCLFVPLPR